MRGALAAIVALFVGWCCAFNMVTPYRKPGILLHQRKTPIVDVGAPDERQHANYVKHLMDGKGFPVLVPGQPDTGENIENHQPPLYYILAAGWCKLAGQDPTDPSQGFWPRLLNTLVGCATLLGVYRVAKWAGFDEPVALGATAFTAFMPMFIALHAAVNNDPLLFCACTWSLAFSLRALREGGQRDVYIAGGLFGLALLTKTSGLALVPMLAVCGAVAMKDKGFRAAAPWAGATVLGLVLATPWLLRNQAVYHELFATKIFMETFTGNPTAAGMAEQLGATNYWLNWFLFWTLRSFVGVFGYSDVFLFEQMGLEKSGSLYTAILAIIAIVSAGSLLAPRLGQPAKEQPEPPGARFWAPATTLLVVVCVLYLGFNLRYFQAQARYVYPAISVFAVVAASGMAAWLKDKRKYSWIALAVFLLVLDVVTYSQLSWSFPERMLGPGAS